MDVVVRDVDNGVCIDLRGEADGSSQRQLRAALSTVNLDDVQVVSVHVGRLTFCDVAAFREILRFTTNARRQRCDVSVHDASPTLRKLALIFGAEEEMPFG